MTMNTLNKILQHVPKKTLRIFRKDWMIFSKSHIAKKLQDGHSSQRCVKEMLFEEQISDYFVHKFYIFKARNLMGCNFFAIG